MELDRGARTAMNNAWSNRLSQQTQRIALALLCAPLSDRRCQVSKLALVSCFEWQSGADESEIAELTPLIDCLVSNSVVLVGLDLSANGFMVSLLCVALT